VQADVFPTRRKDGGGEGRFVDVLNVGHVRSDRFSAMRRRV